MTGTLAGKVAIVTGAGSGIGQAIAWQYAREGAKVVVSDVDEAGGKKTLDEIKANGGEAAFARADVSKPADNEALVKTALDTFGGLQVACNNAGIGGPIAPTGDYPLDGWEKVIAVNLSGVFFGMRYQIPAMVASGGGSIVNISSILGQVGYRKSPAYVAAKHGVVGLTRSAAIEYADKGVRVNSVGPAFIRTPLLTNNLDEKTLSGLASLHPMGRLGESRGVAELVTWLSSDKASFVTGSYYPVDGGYLSK